MPDDPAAHEIPRRCRGLTLIELCVVVALVAILAAMAAPSMRELLERRALLGAADALATDLFELRALAVSRNEGLVATFQAQGQASCYVLHTGSTGQCTCLSDGPAECMPGASAIKKVGFPSGGPVRLLTSTSIRLHPVRGTAAPGGTIRMIDRQGRQVHHVVAMTGRIKTCSPGGKIGGYKPCAVN